MAHRIHRKSHRSSSRQKSQFSALWRVGLIGALASGILVLGSAAPSSASTTLGYTSNSSLICPTVDLIEFTPASGGTSYTVPSTGYLSSWSTGVGTGGVATVSLEVWRPVSGGDELLYRSSGAATTQGVNNTETLSPAVAVQAGDLIGLGTNQGSGSVSGCIEAPENGGSSSWGYVFGPTGVSSTVSTFYNSSGEEINVSAQFTTTISQPAVTGISPAGGSVLGGTSVTISGSDLASATSVKFGATSATIVSDTATSITATAPAAAATGTVNVSVTTAAGTSTTSGADQFFYQKADQIVHFTSGVPVATIGSTYSPTASADSGLTPVITVDPSSTNSACSLSGSIVTFAHAGNCVLDAGQSGSALYNSATTVQQSITVPLSPSTLTWTAPSAITYGTAIDATELDASASVAGTYSYSPALGSVLTAGNHSLGVTFTPSNSADYSPSTMSVTIDVLPAPLSVTASSPTVTYGSVPPAIQASFSGFVNGDSALSLGTAPSCTTAVTASSAVGLYPSICGGAVDPNYSISYLAGQVTLTKATPQLTWATPAAITYGTALGASQLDASASVPGTFTYSPALGAVMDAGTHTLSVTFKPSDAADYPISTATVMLVVNPASPEVNWATPNDLTYGATLGLSELDASSPVVGTFNYSPAAGSTPSAGNDTLNVSFTPNDTTDYASVTKSVSLSVAKATPSLTWSLPSSITFGTVLGSSQLDASAAVPGTFAYSPAAGSTPAAGTADLRVTFTPTDTGNYSSATKGVSLSVAKLVPSITWPTPSALTYGATLGSSQLDATSSVPGTFTYSPAAGSTPPAGTDNLSVTFSPSQPGNVTGASKSITLPVNKATPQLSWPSPSAITYGTALGSSQLDASSSVAGTFSYSPATGSQAPAGTDTLNVTFVPTDANDYTTATTSASLSVAQAAPVVTWPTPAAITQGTALDGTELNATASVPGTFSYSPPAGTSPAAGTDNLSATFTPTDATNYQSATQSVSLEVDPPTAAADPATSDSGTTTTVPAPGSTTTTLPAAPPGTVDISIDGQPGLSISNGKVHVSGHGFRAGSIVTILAHSAPVELGSAKVTADGRFNTTVSLPGALPVGAHHIVVSGVLKNGSVVAQTEAFTVATGGVLGVVGSVPPGPLSKDIAFIAASHPGAVLTTTAGATAAVGAIGSALGGGMGGGGRSGGGGNTGGGSSSGGGGGYLEDVELEREDLELTGGSRGDRSRTWRWPGTGHLDHFSKHYPSRVAAVSPVAGRVLVDGDYLRAMFGSAWLLLCALAFGLGLYASASTGWFAVPPALGIFLAVLGVSILDSTLGYLAGIGFFSSALFAGHITSATEVRTAAGIVLIWFAVPLAAAAIRPLRRNLELHLAGLWERATDIVIAGLFGAWAAQKMTGALSGLAGVELPLDKSVNTVGFAVLGFIVGRIFIESIAAHHYPKRIERVIHHGELESENLQVGLSLLVQIVLFLFISISFMGSSWPLYVGAAVFFSPLVPWLFADRIPKSRFVTKWKPKGLVNWTLIIVTGVVLSKVLGALIHDDKLLEGVGFILLPLPVLASWALELFEDEEEEEEEGEKEEGTEAELRTVDGEHAAAGEGEVRDGQGREGEFALVSSPSQHDAQGEAGAGEALPHHPGHDSGVAQYLEAESARSRFREAEREREKEHVIEERASSAKAWLRRLAGVPLVVVAVYLVVTHLAGG